MKVTHEQRVKQAEREQEYQPTQAEKDQALTVRKSNQLIQENRFDMTVREQRLLLYCISKIKPTDKGTETYTINIRDVCKACGIESSISGNEYNSIREAIKKLDSYNFEITDEHHRKHILHWIRSVVIDPEDANRASIRFEFDPKTVPYLFNVRKFFTQYELGGVLKMKSSYGIKLYELLKSYANIRKKKFTLAEIKYLLGAEQKSYEKYGLFRTYVIDPAMKDIATYSDLKVDYIEVKEKRKVVGIEFIITDIGGSKEFYERQGMIFEDEEE